MNPRMAFDSFNPIRRVDLPRALGGPGSIAGSRTLGRAAKPVRQAASRAGETVNDAIDRMEAYVDRTDSRTLVGIGFALLGVGILCGATLAGLIARSASEREAREEEGGRGRAGGRRRRRTPSAGASAAQPDRPPAHGGLAGGMANREASGLAPGRRGGPSPEVEEGRGHPETP